MRIFASMLSAVVLAVSGVTVTPDIYDVLSKSDFLSGVGQYYNYDSSTGVCRISSDFVYSSPSLFPEDTSNLTAYVFAPVSEFPVVTSP